MAIYPNRDASPRADDLAKAVKFAAKQAVLTGVRTLVPGMVEEYDADTKRAVVQLIIKQSFIDGSTAPRAPLVDVPIIQPSTGGFMVHLPVNEGDIVAVAFTQTGLSTFKRDWGNGELVEPVPASAFTDTIAFPWGMYNYSPIANEGIVLQNAEGTAYIQIKDDEIILKVGRGNARLREDHFDTWSD